MKKFFLLLAILTALLLAACGGGAEEPGYSDTNGTRDEANGPDDETNRPGDEANGTGGQTPGAAERPNIHGKLTRIEYGDNVAYIMGSMHLGRPHWFPLADITEAAMTRADVFVFEVDMDALMTPDAALMEHAERLQILPEGTTMADILPPDILENFLEQLPTYGIEFEHIERLTPVSFLMTLSAEMSELIYGVDALFSVDAYVQNFALRSGLPILGLNDIFNEFSLIFDIPFEIQAYALADFPSFVEFFETMMEFDLAGAYETQDMSVIHDMWLLAEYDAAGNPYMEHFNYINLHVRCNIFADGIASLLRDTEEPTTFFVTIGMAHILGGNLGKVLYLLEDMGFELTPLWQEAQ